MLKIRSSVGLFGVFSKIYKLSLLHLTVDNISLVSFVVFQSRSKKLC
jgi:hypothetical protein